MKVQFSGTIEEFTTIFRGLALEFDLADDEELIEENLSYRPDPPTEVRTKAALPMYQSAPEETPLGEREAIPFPENTSHEGSTRKLTPKERAGCVKVATDFFCAWVEGFGDESAEQPNRVDLIESIGSSQWTVPFLLLCYEHGSLQKFCGLCLTDTHREKHVSNKAWWKWIDLVACNIVQVSVAGFPDVQGTYDYSTRWKREALGEK